MSAKQLLTKEGFHNSFWGKIIIRAEKRGYFTELDVDKSGDWFSGACGRLDDHVERKFNGEPCDHDLFDLGDDFHRSVYVNDIDDAAETLIAIEKRSIKLLKEAS